MKESNEQTLQNFLEARLDDIVGTDLLDLQIDFEQGDITISVSNSTATTGKLEGDLEVAKLHIDKNEYVLDSLNNDAYSWGKTKFAMMIRFLCLKDEIIKMLNNFVEVIKLGEDKDPRYTDK